MRIDCACAGTQIDGVCRKSVIISATKIYVNTVLKKKEKKRKTVKILDKLYFSMFTVVNCWLNEGNPF